jgi:alpha-glucosidase
VGDAAACNVGDQRRDPASLLRLCRDLIALRRGRPELRTGSSSMLEAPAAAWVWRRGTDTVVAVNCSERAVEIAVGPGTILVGTVRDRDGRDIDDPLRLDPWEAVVIGLRPEG